MGTNYYARAESTCNNPEHDHTLHIGKSSGGWKFGFHAIPDHEPPLTSWSAWRAFLTDHQIVDEYGREVSLDEFVDVVEKRYTPTGLTRPICRVDPTPAEVERGFGGRRYLSRDDFHDDEGFDFTDGEFS